MSSQQSTIDFIVEQMSDAGMITARKMFGEYGVYCDGKIVALVCDDELFVKPTEAGGTFIKNVTEKPAYPGAKPYFWISGELWDDRDWLSELIKITTRSLPTPKLKKKKQKI